MQMLEVTRIRILVAHANPLIAVGLATALRRSEDFDVAVDGIDVGPGAALPDVVVADCETGLRRAAAHREARGTAAPRVLVMCGQLREHEVRRALEQGVHGYLPLDSAIDEFVHGVRTVARGARYLAPSTAQCMADSLTREALTAREAEVLDLLACGQCNKSIARQLDIAVGTVKAHVKAIMAKLDASSRTQAVSVAAQRGLVTLADRPAAFA
ncbi:DNA-binding response regulator [Rubrivivax sp. RP6-9]|uniref:response regulator transcription factor n=1 Tax=Rubrivivax sp. RP6-9 TaxID=3415750 RepID=UPI003CC64276